MPEDVRRAFARNIRVAKLALQDMNAEARALDALVDSSHETVAEAVRVLEEAENALRRAASGQPRQLG